MVHILRRLRFWLLAVLLVPFFLASCARPVQVTVLVDEDARSTWNEAVAANPLPEEFVLLPTESAATVRVVSTIGPLPAAGRVLSSRWLVPTRDLTERPGRITGAEALVRSEELLALESVSLPLVAEAVDGRYASDPDYPLVEQVVLTADLASLGLEGDDPGLSALETWVSRFADERAAPAVSWIGGVGDIMLERGMTGLLDREDGLAVVFSDVLPELQGVDLLLGNLEGAVTTGGVEAAKSFTFRFHPRVLPRLADAGFDYLSVVNNHSYDFGESGFRDTLTYLRESTIGTSGAGVTPEEAARPFVRELPGGEVRVLSVGAYPVERSGFDGARETAVTPERAGVLWADPRNPAAQAFALEAMAAAFSETTLDIVMVHGGAEWATGPSQAQRDLYRRYLQAGADLVLGHHSHVTQGLEAHEGGLIAYSLGNFIFPGMFLTEYGEESMLLRIGIADARVRYLEILPVRINHQLLSIDDDPAALDRFYAATARLNE